MNIDHQEFQDRLVHYLSGNLTEAEETCLENDALANPEYTQIFRNSLSLLQRLSLRSEVSELPSPELKGRMLSAIRSEKSNAQDSIIDKNPELLRAAEGWMASPIPGVTMKVLHTDSGQARHTLLVRMPAGFSYPKHIHHGQEQCLVLEGDLTVNGNRLSAGDYILTDDSTLHHETYTESGCLLMLNTEMSDEFI